MGVGRGAHPEGDIVATPSRGRGMVSDTLHALKQYPIWEVGWRFSAKNHNVDDQRWILCEA
jgi:hypothetical protein